MTTTIIKIEESNDNSNKLSNGVVGLSSRANVINAGHDAK
jgi:hypothetical protein